MNKAHAFLVLALSGCSLSKEDAKAVLVAAYATDDNAYCDYIATATGQEFKSIGSAVCPTLLEPLGVVTDVRCTKHAYGDPRDACEEAVFKLGPKAKQVGDGGYIRIPCGKKKLGDVESTTSKDDGVSVRYTRSTTLDDTLINSLASCELKNVPHAGTSIDSVRMHKNDDGNWQTPLGADL